MRLPVTDSPFLIHVTTLSELCRYIIVLLNCCWISSANCAAPPFIWNVFETPLSMQGLPPCGGQPWIIFRVNKKILQKNEVKFSIDKEKYLDKTHANYYRHSVILSYNDVIHTTVQWPNENQFNCRNHNHAINEWELLLASM